MSRDFSSRILGLSDLHQHLLWGLDDGPKDADGMHAMLKDAHAQNIRRIAATTHACPGFVPFNMQLYSDRLSEAQSFCDRNDMDLTIMPGAEIRWTYNVVSALRRRQVPAMNDSDCVLIELWEKVSWDEVREAVRSVLRAGYMPILAHVERYWCFTFQPGRAISLKHELPVAYQVNASTIITPTNLMQKLFVSRMLRAQAFDVLASDAHNCGSRKNHLKKAYGMLEERCGSEYAQALVNFDGVIR